MMAADKKQIEKKTRKKKQNKYANNYSTPLAKNKSVKDQSPSTKTLLIFGATCIIGMVYSHHLSTLFENDRYFSALSPLERELSFRTEMGLYYSYYKTLVESPSFGEGLNLLINDNITEYPNTINTLKRFNLYPEVILGTLYRGLVAAVSFLKIDLKECYKINRGMGQSSIETCSGITVPSYFYVNSIFILHSLLPISIFLLSIYLSDSVWAGVISIVMLFYNHGEVTRVMWTPPLRESFSMPFLFLQFLILTKILRSKENNWSSYVMYSVLTLAFMVPWQFSQFTMLTQVLCLFSIYSIGLIEPYKMTHLLITQMVTLLINTVVQYGNVLLLSSYYAFCLPVCLLVVLCHSVFERLKWTPLIVAIKMVSMLVGSITAKLLCGHFLNIQDDAHIGSILLSKFTSYKDFHTQLYTCAAEFDFISLSYFGNISLTLLLPLATFVIFRIIQQTVVYIFKRSSLTEDIQQTQTGLDVASLYHVLQAIIFSVLMTLIMRLKLFFTPQLCLLTGLLTSNKVLKLSTVHKYWLVGAIISLSSIAGWYNINTQMNYIGEYNNPEMEKLLLWINSSTPKDAVFAGSMPLMASIKLSTGRPIVNHPHYEDSGIRERTLKVYTMYSRRTPQDVYSNLANLGVQYAIVEQAWCNKGHSHKLECSFDKIYLKYFPDDHSNPIFCLSLKDITFNPHPFTTVYTSQEYTVLTL